MPLKHLEAAVKALAAETLTDGSTKALANISRAVNLLGNAKAEDKSASVAAVKRGRKPGSVVAAKVEGEAQQVIEKVKGKPGRKPKAAAVVQVKAEEIKAG